MQLPEGREGWLVVAHRHAVMPWKRIRNFYYNLRIGYLLNKNSIKDRDSAHRYFKANNDQAHPRL